MPQTARCARDGTPRPGIPGATPSRPLSADRAGIASAQPGGEEEECCEQRRAGTEERSSLGRRADEPSVNSAKPPPPASLRFASVAAHAADRPRPAPRSNAHREGPVGCGAPPLEARSDACERRDQSARKTNQQARDRHVQLEQRRPDCPNPPRLQPVDDGARITDGSGDPASPPASASTAASDEASSEDHARCIRSHARHRSDAGAARSRAGRTARRAAARRPR